MTTLLDGVTRLRSLAIVEEFSITWRIQRKFHMLKAYLITYKTKLLALETLYLVCS